MSLCQKLLILSVLTLFCWFGSFYFHFVFLLLDQVWLWFRPPFSVGFLATLVYLVATTDEMDYPAFPIILVYGFGYHYYENFSYLQFCQQQWLNVLLGVVAYFVIGLIWVFPRFKLYLQDKQVRQRLQQVLNRVTVTSPNNSPPNSPPTTRSGASTPQTSSPHTTPPKTVVDEDLLTLEAQWFIAQNKMRLYTWIVYWPLSMVHTLTHDAIREFLNWAYQRLLRGPLMWLVKRAIRDAANHDD